MFPAWPSLSPKAEENSLGLQRAQPWVLTLEKTPRKEIGRSNGSSMLDFQRIIILFSIAIVLVYIPISNVEELHFPHNSPAFVVFGDLDDSYSY